MFMRASICQWRIAAGDFASRLPNLATGIEPLYFHTPASATIMSRNSIDFW
jgi:hypothetical protein